ncbi:hypothetical protein [Nafulsella turpanensis]|uniref:hypothetical protein n=1 Tax=Nafulsella turpanensis TaxID=1265690 RepID=UPI000345017F|nr:hypothetical protein [Nafulsella turpanensis]
MEINITKEEQFNFTSRFKKILGIVLVVGILAVIGGIVVGISGGEEHHGAEHEATEVTEEFRTGEGSGDGPRTHAPGTGDPQAFDMAAVEHGPDWVTRLFANLWINNLFFTGLAIIGVFFVAIQYVSQAGWSTGFLRIPLAMGAWLPYAGVLMLVVFWFGSHDLFHWTHEGLYEKFLADGKTPNPEYDEIIAGKEAYLNTAFYIGRTIAYFIIWAGAFYFLRKKSLEEDINGGTSYWYTLRKYSAIFLVLFAVTSSTAAWDWVMSIDPHWFSTLFGWYVFSSWWVSGLAAITLVVILLREHGYLKVVNANHVHDLGKFVFAFSIFWTYLWFSQFLLIYYANIPEESIYFIERLSSDYYSPIFFINLVINFVFPFFVLMTRDAKRHSIFLKITCIAILFGHWLDFYLMVTPGVMKEYGGFGLLETGLTLIYGAAFLFVTFTALSKVPLVPKNHPMLEESLHHHI